MGLKRPRGHGGDSCELRYFVEWNLNVKWSFGRDGRPWCSECEVELWERQAGLGVLSLEVVQPGSVCPGSCRLLCQELACLDRIAFHHQSHSHKMQWNSVLAW